MGGTGKLRVGPAGVALLHLPPLQELARGLWGRAGELEGRNGGVGRPDGARHGDLPLVPPRRVRDRPLRAGGPHRVPPPSCPSWPQRRNRGRKRGWGRGQGRRGGEEPAGRVRGYARAEVGELPLHSRLRALGVEPAQGERAAPLPEVLPQRPRLLALNHVRLRRKRRRSVLQRRAPALRLHQGRRGKRRGGSSSVGVVEPLAGRGPARPAHRPRRLPPRARRVSRPRGLYGGGR
mmetsp:Transcript_7514/g.17166  ORF Transcript_7514/g.17166 Transcript_7514/m.17166 type:complete len:235 (-) Transcript_7514:614-1318(-)